MHLVATTRNLPSNPNSHKLSSKLFIVLWLPDLAEVSLDIAWLGKFGG